MSIASTTFQGRIRVLREAKGLSQSELARICGFQPSAIAHFEGGRRSPSLNSLERLSNGLGVTIDSLINGEQNDNGDNDLLKVFQRLSSRNKKLVFKLIETLYDEQRIGVLLDKAAI